MTIFSSRRALGGDCTQQRKCQRPPVPNAASSGGASYCGHSSVTPYIASFRSSEGAYPSECQVRIRNHQSTSKLIQSTSEASPNQSVNGILPPRFKKTEKSPSHQKSEGTERVGSSELTHSGVLPNRTVFPLFSSRLWRVTLSP
jgi:hypothetical protein